MNREQLMRLTDGKHWFRYWMPYTFKPLNSSDYKYLYLPLNRNYKPLGMYWDENVDYQAFSETHGVLFKATPLNISSVWINGLFLYDDTPQSREDYFARLARLMSYSIEMVASKKEKAKTL